MKQAIFVLITVAMIVSGRNEAGAFWGGNTSPGSTGLDVAAGYDVNTVTTLGGTVVTPPAKNDQSQHTQMTIATQQGAVNVLLGPWDYWEKQAFIVNMGQEISTTGSLAQGKDGSVYLFAQKLDNNTKSTSITLRSESGKPFWSRGGPATGSGNRNGNRSGSGAGAGSGYRGGSMRGGGRR